MSCPSTCIIFSGHVSSWIAHTSEIPCRRKSIVSMSFLKTSQWLEVWNLFDQLVKTTYPQRSPSYQNPMNRNLLPTSFMAVVPQKTYFSVSKSSQPSIKCICKQNISHSTPFSALVVLIRIFSQLAVGQSEVLKFCAALDRMYNFFNS